MLEWLPQETIFFNGADVVLDSEIALEGDAQYLGCEILCFGRTAHGERFTQGRLRQRLMITRDDKPIWFEQGDLRADSRMITSPLGLAGYTVCATLIVAGANAPAAGAADSSPSTRAASATDPPYQCVAIAGKRARGMPNTMAMIREPKANPAVFRIIGPMNSLENACRYPRAESAKARDCRRNNGSSTR